MLETQIYEFFAFGHNYKLLREGARGWRLRGDSSSLESLLTEFFGYLGQLDLKVTNNAANALLALREEIKSAPSDANVDEELAKKVAQGCDELDHTLDAELKLCAAFVVTPKRFDLSHLLRTPGNLFADNVFQELPVICKSDFSEACLCIAFGRPTAAAFHLMRGTEGVIRHLYCSIIKRDRVDPLLWHPMIDHLRKRRDGLSKPTLDHLDNIRTNFRNPTQHPELRYDLDEVQDLLAVCIDSVNRIIRELRKRSK